MVYENPARVEAQIKRLTREIDEIDKYFYGSQKDKDRLLYMGMLERKRDDVVRSAVLQLHTSIEDLMTDTLFSRVLGTPHRKSRRKRRGTKRGQALERMVSRLGFDAKLDFAVVVGLFAPTTAERLKELNKIRNKCSHHWVLDAPARVGRKTKGKRPRLLTFGGRDLHHIPVLKDFVSEYGRIYYKLFARSFS